MDVQSQILAKRAAAHRARELADRLSGDYRIDALVFAAELEIQADAFEHQLLVPSLTKSSELRPQ